MATKGRIITCQFNPVYGWPADSSDTLETNTFYLGISFRGLQPASSDARSAVRVKKIFIHKEDESKREREDKSCNGEV